MDACLKNEEKDDSVAQLLCELCNEKAPISCSRCRNAWYCSRDHQKQHWDQHSRDCRLYKMENSAEAGNYLIASSKIRAGRKIITEDPLAIGPMTMSFPVCLTCHVELSEEDHVKCPDCLWPMCSPRCFCSKQHDKECNILSKDRKNCVAPDNFSSTPRYDIILIIRCLLLRETDRALWSLLMSMESHWEKLKDSDDPYHVAGVRVLSEIYEFPVDLVHRIRGVITSNAMQVRGPDGILLRAVYPSIYLLNHSCIPNIHLSCNLKGKMEARAAVDIPIAEPLTISYSGTLLPTWERRDYLLKLHHFVCNCKRCSDPTELGTNFSFPRCPKCLREYLTPVPALSTIKELWQCPRCKTECDVAEITQEIDDWLFRMDMNELFGTGTLPRIKSALSKIEFSFHRSHYLYLKGSQEALVKLKNNNCFQALKLKREIWENMIHIFDQLEPGLTLRKAMGLYELGSITISLAEEGFRGEMSAVQAESYMKEGVDLCRNSTKILSLEPRDAPESQMILSIMKKISEVSSCVPAEPLPAVTLT